MNGLMRDGTAEAVWRDQILWRYYEWGHGESITGPNGSGKSTLLNAILFGLGESISQLGARQKRIKSARFELTNSSQHVQRLTYLILGREGILGNRDLLLSIISPWKRAINNADLASAAHAEVELLFGSVSRGVSDVKVFSAVSRANGQRTFAFNGQKLPKHRFDHFLRTRLGIATGNPFWRVSQDGIHRLLQASPHALRDVLCEVSGTRAINAHRSTALKQLGRWKKSLAVIQANISALEEAVHKEGAHLTAMDRVREITAELESIPADVKKLDNDIGMAELFAARHLVKRLRAEEEDLEAERDAAEGRLQSLEAEAAQTREKGSGTEDANGSETLQNELLIIVTDLAKSSTEFKLETAALREKEELQAKWGEILHAAKAERVNLESRCSELRGKSTMMRERRGLQEQEVANIRAQLPSGAAGPRDDGEALQAARRALDDISASVTRSGARRATLSVAISRAETEVEEIRSEAQVATAAVDEVWEKMKQIGSPLRAPDDMRSFLREIEAERDLQRSHQLDLSRELQRSGQEVAAAARRIGAPQWCSRLVAKSADVVDFEGCNHGNRHRGFLFELFELRNGPGDGYHQALASLLSSSLTVWVCDSSGNADEALDLAKANEAGLRVWPIMRLRAVAARFGCLPRLPRGRRVGEAVEWALRRWPGQVKVIDPASLLAWNESDEGVTAAMDKALGTWIITEDVEVSALLLAELGMSSVTKMGVRHAPGEVVGGEVQGEEARLRGKFDWDRAVSAQREAERALKVCAEGCRDLTRRLESGAELARLQARLAVLKREAQECAERLAEKERSLKGARQKMEWADQEQGRLEAEAAAFGEQTYTADPEGVLSAIRKALTARENELKVTAAACEKVDSEIRSLEEARMEVWERENNAKEALGVNVSSPEEAAADHGDAEDDEGGAVHPRDDASVSPTSRDSPIVVASITPVDDRLAALKRSVESKRSHVKGLERARNELIKRVEEATVQEKGARNRLSTLEEHIADLKAKAVQAGTRLERKQKAICESERRVREITTKLGSHAADGGSLQESSSSSTLGGVGSSPDRRGKKEEGLHSLAGGGDPDKDSNIREGRAIGNTDKETLHAGFSREDLVQKKHELAAKQKMLSAELQAFRRRSEEHDRGSGGPAAVIGAVDEVTVRQRQAKVSVLKQQLQSVLEGTRQLEAGVIACEGRMREANEACYAVVRAELRILFSALCKNKSADLVFEGTKLEEGLRLVVRNEPAGAKMSPAAPAATTDVGRSPQELSGGQQALLGLALVLALASYHAPPLCLLDEVDAALDETNQAAAARLLAGRFNKAQAFCVSHHRDFHRQSDKIIAVEICDGVSRVRV